MDIREQIAAGQYRDYLDRHPRVLDQIVDEIQAEVLRDAMAERGETLPPVVLVGQGDYERRWPDDASDMIPEWSGRGDMGGRRGTSAAWLVPVAFIAGAWLAYCYW